MTGPVCGFENTRDTRFCGNCVAPRTLPSEPPAFPTKTMGAPPSRELGREGMGLVYKVFDTKIKETIVLKLIKPEIAADRETPERFGNEVRLAALKRS